ncbi:hypothetical protein RclHR1_20570001 [Rhizophagus clarus]|uniref:RNase H type-1 domain-containing protein n=1 Tax=Rhizophagus clarus TaxID=94130 RepID=A0A2Z6RKD4_9GLOM|nr:hypothetical protein RclHR1_20570001 [Rhizophagus clarus]
MQVTHLFEKDCYTATQLIHSLIKQKANFSRSLPNPLLYLSQALGLTNLFSHLFLIPISSLMVDDWSLWSNMKAFKCDYIACTLASLISTPFRLQHASFNSISSDLTLPGHTPLYSCMSPQIFKACLKTAYRAAYIAQLADKRDRSLPHKWYLDIQAHTTIPDSHDHLHSRFVCSSSVTPTATLIPVSYSRRLNISPDFSSSSLVADDDLVQLVPDAGYLNSVATYAHGTIRHWPFFTRAEVAVIFAALSVSPDDSTISIYTDSQAAIDGLRLCASSSYTNSCSYYMTTNFELWASIECSIRAKLLAVFPVKVKGHAGNYWNEFTDSLANSAHRSDDAICLSMADFTSSHNVSPGLR